VIGELSEQMKRIVLLAFCLLAVFAWADELELYVFNHPFQGRLWMNHASLYAEVVPLIKLLGAETKPGSGKSIVFVKDEKGAEIPLAEKDGAGYVSVKEVASALGLGFNFNPQTKIVDLFVPKRGVPDQPKRASAGLPGSPYTVDIIKTEEEKGIDELAVLVTLQNKGIPVPHLKVICNFMDEDRKPLETQSQDVANFAEDESKTVSFKMVYPKASNTDTYREYNTKIKYDISLSY
jgi:hypothetical protein